MKKFNFFATLVLGTLALSACGNEENINKEEAVKQTIPQLVANTANAVNDNGDITLNADIKSFSAEVTYDELKVTLPFSGKATLGATKLFAENVNERMVGVQLYDCNGGYSYQPSAEAEVTSGKFDQFGLGVYFAGETLYLDVSNENLIKGIVGVVNSFSSSSFLSEATIKSLLGGGKLYFADLISFPVVEKKEVNEESIATTISDAFSVVDGEDLETVMDLVHDKSKGTYTLKFTIDDPEIVNRNINNNDEKDTVKYECDDVELAFEARTNNQGVFEGLKLKGFISAKSEEGADTPLTAKISIDAELSIDYTGCHFKNPVDLSSFKSGAKIISFIEGLLN